jgi:prepilin-type N-terminal cleavage/methylation domain-containing protein
MRLRRQIERGFTLLELAIVIAIVSILALVAVPNLNQMLPRFRLNNAVREFANNVQLIRLMAVSQNREYRLCLSDKDSDPTNPNIVTNRGAYLLQAGNSSSGSTSWSTLPASLSGGVYIDQQGTFTLTWSTSNRTYAGVSITGWNQIGGPGSGNGNCIVFSPRGWVTNPTDDFVSGYIQVYFRNKAANPRNDSRTILISRGGLTRIRVGDSNTVDTGA